MSDKPQLIQGGQYRDSRGVLTFLNDFNMVNVRRFYIVENSTVEIIRGWRGHKIEQRWFYASDGEFLIRLVKIDDFESPSKSLDIIEFILSSRSNQVLHVPVGYASSTQARKNHSKLLVFGDYEIEHSHLDDYLYPLEYFG